MFKEYRQAYDEMMSDPQIDALLDKIAGIKAELDHAAFELSEFEAPYRARMDKAAEEITAAVIGQKQTVLLHGVEAKYSAGKRSTSWKSVAVELNATPELIKKFTTDPTPSVNIKVTG